MEKMLSPDERIRRAEEIYYRKKIQANNKTSTRVNVSDKKDFGMLKKMILQMVICILLYSIFYMIKNTNYIFSEDVINKTRGILSYDINLKKMYEEGMQYINSFIEIQEPDINIENNTEDSIKEESEEQNDTLKEKDENIGGENVAIDEEETQNLTQMEQDAKDILATNSFVSPLMGVITSRYGPRNPTDPKVSKYHTGIDIAANEGTIFVAAMSGVVKSVSSVGDYRESCKNYKWRCYDDLCPLQDHICKRRRPNKPGTRNWRGWFNR